MTLPRGSELRAKLDIKLMVVEMKLDRALHYYRSIGFRSRNLLEHARHCKKREEHPLYKELQSCAPSLREYFEQVNLPLFLDHSELDSTILEIEIEIEDDLREPYCPAFQRIMRKVLSPKKHITENGMVQLAEVIHKVVDRSNLAPEFPIKREIDVALDKWFDILGGDV